MNFKKKKTKRIKKMRMSDYDQEKDDAYRKEIETRFENQIIK